MLTPSLEPYPHKSLLHSKDYPHGATIGRMDEPEKQSHRYSDADVIKAVRNVDMATTMMIAEELGCSRSGAYQRLTKLRDDGRIESSDVGNSLLWSVSE